MQETVAPCKGPQWTPLKNVQLLHLHDATDECPSAIDRRRTLHEGPHLTGRRNARRDSRQAAALPTHMLDATHDDVERAYERHGTM